MKLFHSIFLMTGLSLAISSCGNEYNLSSNNKNTRTYGDYSTKGKALIDCYSVINSENDNSTIDNSTVSNNSTIDNSTISDNSTIYNSTISDNSFVSNSIIINSKISNSIIKSETLINVTIYNSSINNSK